MDFMKSICTTSDLVEDNSLKLSILGASMNILLQCVTTLLFIPISLVCLPLYVIGLIIWGRPPTISPWSRFYKYFTATFTEGKPEEGIPFTNRILLFILFFDCLIKSPINGVGWFLDEIFYPAYHKCEIKNPLFFITAPRSGSTQLADYLEEDDENFLAPMFIEGMFPYIWAWRTIGPLLNMTGLKKYFKSPTFFFGEETKKRHNSSYCKTESWDIVVGASHMTFLSWSLGASFFKWGTTFPVSEKQPADREFWRLFVEFTDRIMKKVLYHRGLPNQQIFIKGHFLIAIRELEQRYDGAKFLTVVREPLQRLQSAMNLFYVLSADGPPKKLYGLSPITWRVVRDSIMESQVCYCEEEMIFYNQSEENRLAISFDTYVKNLADTFQRVYSFLNIPVSAELLSKAAVLQKSSHDRTKRKTTYDPKYNRSLSSLGIDEEKLKEYLSDYINWMKSLE